MKPVLVVLAAGLGSRYGGQKQIDVIGPNGECLLDYAAFDAKRAGFEKIVYVIRQDIEQEFKSGLFARVSKNIKAQYVFQEKTSLLTQKQQALSKARQKPWGTIHALMCAKQNIAAPFAVINADDYYGYDAFKTMGEYLACIEKNSIEHAMIAYTLGKTLCKSGSVSRGVCQIQNGYLCSIKEHKQIEWQQDSIISTQEGKKQPLDFNAIVSMNFFGFSLSAFDTFDKYWGDFLQNYITHPTKEALLPEAAGLIISSGAGKIKVFTSKEAWFGMTYQQDKETVKKEIANKIATGYYPQNLWQK